VKAMILGGIRHKLSYTEEVAGSSPVPPILIPPYVGFCRILKSLRGQFQVQSGAVPRGLRARRSSPEFQPAG